MSSYFCMLDSSLCFFSVLLFLVFLLFLVVSFLSAYLHVCVL